MICARVSLGGNIRKLYETPQVRLAPDAAEYLSDVANQVGHGSLRRCDLLVRNAVLAARKRLRLGEGETVVISACDLEYVERYFRHERAERQAVDDRRRVAIA